jgi:hypothetical protein
MHETADFAFLRKISGKNATNHGMLRGSINDRLLRAGAAASPSRRKMA